MLQTRTLKPHNRNYFFFSFALTRLVINVKSLTSVMRCGSSSPSSPAKGPNHWWKQPQCFTRDEEKPQPTAQTSTPHRVNADLNRSSTGPAALRPISTSASRSALLLLLLHHAKSPNTRTHAHTHTQLQPRGVDQHTCRCNICNSTFCALYKKRAWRLTAAAKAEQRREEGERRVWVRTELPEGVLTVPIHSCHNNVHHLYGKHEAAADARRTSGGLTPARLYLADSRAPDPERTGQ